MSWKNQLLKGALKLIPAPQHAPTDEKRILVFATTALGDTLWATPALESLRKSFPRSYIAVLTSPVGREVLKHNPWIDQIYLLEEPLLPRFFSLQRKLYKEQFDTVLIFHASQRLAIPLASKLGAREVVGTAGINKGLDSLLTKALPNDYQHEIIRRLKMVEAIGGDIHAETLSLPLAREDQAPPLPPGRWVALHPGSKDGFKRWPAENFAAVGRQLMEKHGCKILITGVSSEKALMEEVSAMIPGSMLADTKWPLRRFASLIEKVDLLISNDTGPVHVACAVGAPVIAIYSSTDPNLCGPHKAKRAIALYKRRTCEPCLKRTCRVPFCLLQIGPDDVVRAAIRIFSQ